MQNEFDFIFWQLENIAICFSLQVAATWKVHEHFWLAKVITFDEFVEWVAIFSEERSLTTIQKVHAITEIILSPYKSSFCDNFQL